MEKTTIVMAQADQQVGIRWNSTKGGKPLARTYNNKWVRCSCRTFRKRDVVNTFDMTHFDEENKWGPFQTSHSAHTRGIKTKINILWIHRYRLVSTCCERGEKKCGSCVYRGKSLKCFVALDFALHASPRPALIVCIRSVSNISAIHLIRRRGNKSSLCFCSRHESPGRVSKSCAVQMKLSQNEQNRKKLGAFCAVDLKITRN